MKNVLRAVSTEKVEKRVDFRSQFTDLLKNVNQSYSLLKNSIVESKKTGYGTETAATDDKGDQSAIQFFRKIKQKKEQPRDSRLSDVRSNLYNNSQKDTGTEVVNDISNNLRIPHLSSITREKKAQAKVNYRSKGVRIGTSLKSRGNVSESEESSTKDRVDIIYSKLKLKSLLERSTSQDRKNSRQNIRSIGRGTSYSIKMRTGTSLEAKARVRRNQDRFRLLDESYEVPAKPTFEGSTATIKDSFGSKILGNRFNSTFT